MCVGELFFTRRVIAHSHAGIAGQETFYQTFKQVYDGAFKVLIITF